MAVKFLSYEVKKLSWLQNRLFETYSNLNSNSKHEAFSLNRSRENEGQSWYLRALVLKY